MRSSRFSPTIGLLLCGVALSLGFAGCSDGTTSAGVTTGCRGVFGTVDALNLPENSELSCGDINQLISSIPGRPEAYLTKEPHGVLWKCRFYGLKARRVLLSCAHHSRHFSVLKSRS